MVKKVKGPYISTMLLRLKMIVIIIMKNTYCLDSAAYSAGSMNSDNFVCVGTLSSSSKLTYSLRCVRKRRNIVCTKKGRDNTIIHIPTVTYAKCTRDDVRVRYVLNDVKDVLAFSGDVTDMLMPGSEVADMFVPSKTFFDTLVLANDVIDVSMLTRDVSDVLVLLNDVNDVLLPLSVSFNCDKKGHTIKGTIVIPIPYPR